MKQILELQDSDQESDQSQLSQVIQMEEVPIKQTSQVSKDFELFRQKVMEAL